VAALAADVQAGKLAARELVQHALDRIDALDGRVNAFVAVDPEAALSVARDIDQRIADGEQVGDLAGIPLAVKDLEDAAGFVTTHGSAAWADGPASATDSVLVARLKAAGCVVVGKTNTPELGYRADTLNPTFGATRNPWDLTRSPGGSSGGSAAAIACGMVPLATGSDGGGSIRIPSALCGLSGMKPSLGRVPSGGPQPPDWLDLSTRGPMARRVGDVALALDEVIGPDPTDLRALPMPEPSWLGALDDPHVPIKVAWSPTLGYAKVDAQVREVCERAVRLLGELGTEIVEVDTVFTEDPAIAWLTLAATYNARTVEAFRGTEVWERLDPGLVEQLAWAERVSAIDLVKAEDECHRLNVRLVQLFRDVRLLVTPTTAGLTPLSGEHGTVDGEPDVNWIRFTYPFNLTRSPAGTVCAGFTDGDLPVGLQLVGPQHGDLVVLRAMAALEEALDIDTVAPVDG